MGERTRVAEACVEEMTVESIRVIELRERRANLLTLELRSQLLAALERSGADESIAATVLVGGGSCFSGGMDLAAIDDGTALLAPTLHAEILDRLAEMTHPVVAGLHGAAHGGGLELALGCHYRVANEDTILSHPEVLAGLVPGARGTQHLPRAVGLDSAADIILTGRRLRAGRAPAGLIDRLTGTDVRRAAIDFAREIATIRPIPRLQDSVAAPASVDLRSFLTPETAGLPGVPSALSLLDAATHVPYAAAIREEATAFRHLATAEASRPFREALRSKISAHAAVRRERRSSSSPKEDSTW